MKLKKVEILKYKSFENKQEFNLEDDITILVGMNESGKTAALEVIAKTNYFQDDTNFEFNVIQDYPRKEKKAIDKLGVVPDAINCYYVLTQKEINIIEEDLGKKVVLTNDFSIRTNYDNKPLWSVLDLDKKKFIEQKIKVFEITSNLLIEKICEVKNLQQLNELKETYTEEKHKKAISSFDRYFQNTWNWNDPLDEYVTRIHLSPNLPKFLYYDEYYALPSRISIEKLKQNRLDESQDKTAKALIELADINLSELLQKDNFENYIAELEATELIISNELFKYWKTNSNLQIKFTIDKVETINPNNGNQSIIEHILDIRVNNKGVSLPLKNRSKGFNWFFSFLVWFKKIQEDSKSKYILLLDEPGLNLHASAQNNLMDFLEDLSKNYQIIYTTHSPFMIPSGKINRVRTILETDKGSVISDSIQEKDPNTLFPLQAALGYDIAQNLYVNKKNLLVEGVSDLIILSTLSGFLEKKGRTGLNPDISIVPTGGLEKVATFISLLRGSQLDIACLLDSYTDEKGKAKMDNMITEKIIHRNKIRFYDEFLDNYDKADIEDLFTKEEYLQLFNNAFSEYRDITLAELNPKIQQIIIQINKYLNIERFNHYRPANELIKLGESEDFYTKYTLDNFEKVFIEINKLFT